MLTIFGGIGIFLLGMTMLTTGLKEIAGDALKKWLNRFTKGTFSAMLSGMVMTILVQSSTATTLLTIGFVSASLITFTQSIGVIIGANIGSTSTGWIISLIGFKISLQALSMPIIGLGVFISLIAPRDVRKVGGVLTGFGLLFLGIDMLQQGMGSAQDLIAFDQFTADSAWNIFLLIVIGIVMTVIMQASSAAMAATLTALFAGAIDFEQAAYLVIGQNVGTTATALFAAIGASVAAKRTAMTHFLFNVIIAIVVTIIFPYFLQITKWATTLIAGSFDETLGLALFHSFFSIFGALLFLPFIQSFAKLLERMIPERENALTRNLDTSLLSEPSVAIDVAFDTVRNMTLELLAAVNLLMQSKKVTVVYEKKMLDVEEAVRVTQGFLNELSQLSKRDRNKLVSLLHTLDHLTRLLRVLREKQSVEAIYVQERLMGEWQVVLEEIQQSLQDDTKILDISIVLEQKSQQMAQERRERRNQYFERSVDNETQIDVAVSKVEAILWIDRLIYHFWRATARMAEYQKFNTQKSRDVE